MLCKYFKVSFLIKREFKSYCESLISDWKVCYITDESDLDKLLSRRDLLIVDHYEIDEEWRVRYQSAVQTLIVINDIPGKIYGADVIINHCPGINQEKYSTPKETKFLLGLKYAILRPEFLEYALNENPGTHGEGIFICFGAADPYHLGYFTAKELLASGFKNPINLVTPLVNSELEHLCIKYQNLEIVHQLSASEMINFMRRARLLLLSSSILSFEAIALRKPFFAIYFMENQRLIYEGLIAKGMADGQGKVSSSKDLIGIYKRIERLYYSAQILEQMVEKQRQFLDGKSGRHIGETLYEIHEGRTERF